MKRIFVLSLGLMLALATLVLAGISSDQAAQILADALGKQGYKCDVEIGDVDKNGVSDVAIEYQGGNPDDTIMHLLAAITGGVGALDEEVDFKLDKAFVLINDDLWYASVKGIGQCWDLIQEDDSTDADVEDCLSEIWNKKE